MMSHRILVIAVASMLAMSGNGGAQESGERDLFAAPGSPLRCRQIPVSARDSSQGVGTALRFIEGDDLLSQRQIDVRYSAAGDPLHLVVVANVPTTGRPFSTNGVVVRFGPNNKMAGLRIRPDTMHKTRASTRTDSLAALETALQDLSDAEKMRARDLAERLWGRRCGARSTPARP